MYIINVCSQAILTGHTYAYNPSNVAFASSGSLGNLWGWLHYQSFSGFRKGFFLSHQTYIHTLKHIIHSNQHFSHFPPYHEISVLSSDGRCSSTISRFHRRPAVLCTVVKYSRSGVQIQKHALTKTSLINYVAREKECDSTEVSSVTRSEKGAKWSVMRARSKPKATRTT